MATIKCPTCKAQVPATAWLCPRCFHSIPANAPVSVRSDSTSCSRSLSRVSIRAQDPIAKLKDDQDRAKVIALFLLLFGLATVILGIYSVIEGINDLVSEPYSPEYYRVGWQTLGTDVIRWEDTPMVKIYNPRAKLIRGAVMIVLPPLVVLMVVYIYHRIEIRRVRRRNARPHV
jgi:hypothetical protein